ncbi:MAG: imidazoleglycerol-phosphate dehydratase HisB [Flexistipes sinusarabici]|uniref:Imidazoleglycerol-phosphate dehydratase n=1 Tax=Flexistipes sinusarabici TaxID=2352 RepID=A0A5D0MFI3_FLESI|nr:imidazoleglycerol-phosphate dehydratase HisB [Flexistipes sinusarabici]TYB32464.1 MAG: imidazoleglycerol-phosphate dehydratase HisB [Flexistipes sinusarabici]
MSDRIAAKERKTAETNIYIKLNLDGNGRGEINTGSGFFDHMLELFAKHSGFDLKVAAEGDIHVDLHHLVEDTGIVMGSALKEALGDKKGIERYGFFMLPMDETLVETALDLSGRSFLNFDVRFHQGEVGGFDTELVEEFLRAFASNGLFNLHVILRYGSNTHHIAEAVFKSLAKSLRTAVRQSGSGIPSTKGVV